MTTLPKFPFYHGLSKLPLLQKSFGRKLFLITTVGILIPPLGLLIWSPELLNGLNLLFLLILIGVSIGLVGVFFLALLAPLEATSYQLKAYLEERDLPELPMVYQDVVGQLMTDVQYLIEKQQTLETNTAQDSDRDPLTGLLNRQGAMERLRQDLSRAKREEVRLLLVMLDIDGFEGVTGAFGYKTGEISLIRTADLLTSNIRTGDWAARWDGDCFLAILWNYHHAPTSIIKSRLQQVSVETFEGEVLNLSLMVGTWTYAGQGDLTYVLSHIQESLAEARRNTPDDITLHSL